MTLSKEVYLVELKIQLLLSKELNYVPDKDFNELNPKIKELQKMIIGFENSFYLKIQNL